MSWEDDWLGNWDEEVGDEESEDEEQTAQNCSILLIEQIMN